MEIDDDLGRLLSVKRVSENRMLDAYSHVRFWSWLFGGLAVGVIAVSMWVITIRRDVNENAEWIRAQRDMPQRMHDIEEIGKRHDEQIKRLNQKVYGVPEF